MTTQNYTGNKKRYNLSLDPNLVNKIKEIQKKLGHGGKLSPLVESLLDSWGAEMVLRLEEKKNKGSFEDKIKEFEKRLEELSKKQGDYQKL